MYTVHKRRHVIEKHIHCLYLQQKLIKQSKYSQVLSRAIYCYIHTMQSLIQNTCCFKDNDSPNSITSNTCLLKVTYKLQVSQNKQPCPGPD